MNQTPEDRRPTVVFVSHAGGSPYHGPNMRSYFVARNLVKRGYRVWIVSSAHFHKYAVKPTTDGPVTHEVIDGIDYLWVRTYEYRQRNHHQVINQFDFTWKAMSVVKSMPVDNVVAVVASSPHPFVVFPARRLARRQRCPLVFEARDIWPLAIFGTGRMGKRHPYALLLKLVERYAYRKADRIVSVKRGDREYFETHFPAVIDKYRFIPNGFDTSYERLDELSADVARSIPANKFIVGYVGALTNVYDMDLLLDVAPDIQRDHPQVHFVIAGKGEKEAALRARARDLGLDNVTFLGFIPHKYVIALVRRFDVALMLLQATEAYRYGISANKIFEYQFAGAPIITATNTDYDDIAESRCGISLRSGDAAGLRDAIGRMVSMSGDERSAMGRNGRDWLEQHHTYEVIADRYCALLED